MLDMEVHERVIVEGPVGRLKTPLIHDDFKGLEAYIDRHNKYSTWEAKLRYRFLMTGEYGDSRIGSSVWQLPGTKAVSQKDRDPNAGGIAPVVLVSLPVQAGVSRRTSRFNRIQAPLGLHRGRPRKNR